MVIDRAEGTSSSDASGNPSAVSFSIPKSYFRLLEELDGQGFKDALRGETAYLLERTSYEHLKPYLAMIRRHPRNGTPRVQDAHFLMSFDREFQAIAFKYVGIFESQMRAQYAHRMTCSHGGLCLYDRGLFLREGNHARSLEHYSGEVERKARKGDPSVKRALAENGGRCPIELGIECMSLGTLSMLYSNTADRDVTDGVAESFGCTKSELASWLRTVGDARNAFAHFDSYLVRRQIPSTPLAIKGIGASNRKPFYIALLLMHLLSCDEMIEDWTLKYALLMNSEISGLLERNEGLFGYLYGEMGIPEENGRLDMIEAAGGRLVFAVAKGDAGESR